MRKLLNELRERLLRAGIAPRHARRYIAELADHLADLTEEEERAGRGRANAESSALIRLGGIDELSRAMVEQRQFQSLCARAPWAMFGLVPLVLLAGAYFVSCLILWSGWRIFLPGTDTPFVRVDGFAILYFGIGRSLYHYAPILIGWGIGLVAARQRLTAVWPTVSLVLLALAGGMAQVHASRPAVPGGIGSVSMGFGVGPSVGGIPSGLAHALVILALTVLPYLILRFQMGRSLSA